MHEGEIGKSRARALICWPVNQCSLEDLVNISWLIFTSVCFYFISFIIKFVMISTVGKKKSQKKRQKNKKGKKRIRHTMSTIQLLLSHATVRVDICSRDFHLSQVHGNAWISEVASRLLVILFITIFCRHKKMAYMLWVLLLHLIHVSPCGKINNNH